MALSRRLWSWWRTSLRRSQINSEMDAEMRFHLEAYADDLVRSGVPRAEALRRARLEFGGIDKTKEECREASGVHLFETLICDLRYSARALRKSPGFTIVAVLTLALGIGANTAIFSAVNALMLRPLPFTAADQLVRIYSIQKGMVNTFANPDGPSALDVRDFAQRSGSFQNMVAYDTWAKNVSFGESAGRPEQMEVGLVPAAYFEILDIRPIIGRLFTEDENQEGKNFVAAISAQLWRNRFAGDPAVLGRKIRINGEPYSIVAVMPDVIPAWVEPGRHSEIWTPFPYTPDMWSESGRGERGYAVLGRLKPGVSLEQAQADLSVIAAALAAEHPVDQGVGVAVKRLADSRVGALRPMLYLLIGAVSLILLIACVNLANLLLARNSARQRELAVRAALGAGRGGLVRQLLAETLLLSLVGGAVGFGGAEIGLRALARMHPENLPQLGSLGIDWRVLTFTLSVSLVTSLIFGLAPAFMGTRLNLVDALKQGGRSGMSGRSSQRVRGLLVITEMAMCLMLLVGASLLIRSIMRLQGQNLGIRQDHLLRGRIYLPPVRYTDPGVRTRFCDDFAASVRALPGVMEATVTTVYPPNNGWIQMLVIPGHSVTRIQDVPSAQFGVVDQHFLRTLGIPLIRGRDFAESDSASSPPVALISQEFKRRYFASEDPIGRKIHIGPPPLPGITAEENITDDVDVTIIGVIGDFKNAGLALAAQPQITVLYSQNPLVNGGFKDILVRTASEPRALETAIRGQLRALDSDIPLAEVQTIDELVERQTGGQRFTTVLLSLFALAGLVLAIVGIYGVVSFLVARRRQELAVRIALGASRANVLWLVLKQGLEMAGLGAVIGLLGAWAAQKLTSGLLFEISPVDPLTFGGAAVFLLAVAASACAIPGARALQIDPAQTLRED
ncbi:MAG: ABC transporter permease [Candidatus Acidiferrales bacterium]